MKIVEVWCSFILTFLRKEEGRNFWWSYPDTKTDLGGSEAPRIVVPMGSTRVKFFDHDLPPFQKGDPYGSYS